MHTSIFIISAFLALLCLGTSQAWHRSGRTYRLGSLSTVRQPAKKKETAASHRSPWYPHIATPQSTFMTHVNGEVCQVLQALLYKLQCQKSQTQGSGRKSWINRVRCWRVNIIIAQLAGLLGSSCDVEVFHGTDDDVGSVMRDPTTTMMTPTTTAEQTTPATTSNVPTSTTPAADESASTESPTTSPEPTSTTEVTTTTTTTIEPTSTSEPTSTTVDTTTTPESTTTATKTVMTTTITTSQSTTSDDDDDDETETDVSDETTEASSTCVSHGGECVEGSECASDAILAPPFTCPLPNYGCCIVVLH